MQVSLFVVCLVQCVNCFTILQSIYLQHCGPRQLQVFHVDLGGASRGLCFLPVHHAMLLVPRPADLDVLVLPVVLLSHVRGHRGPGGVPPAAHQQEPHHQ